MKSKNEAQKEVKVVEEAVDKPVEPKALSTEVQVLSVYMNILKKTIDDESWAAAKTICDDMVEYFEAVKKDL